MRYGCLREMTLRGGCGPLRYPRGCLWRKSGQPGSPQQHSGIPHPVISLTRPHPHLPHIWRTFYGQLGELLGVGGYGEVFKCIRLGDMARRPFAVKKVKGKKPSDGGPEVVTSTSTMR